MFWTEHPALRLAIALGIGLLIGAERERRKGTGPLRGAAGVRTFALAALAGGVSLLVGGEVLLVVTALVAAAFSVISYQRTSSRDPGLTSEMALVVAVLLGALAIRLPALAAGLGVITAILLASRSRLHRALRELVTEQEAHDVLLFLAATLVILPLAPDHAVGPFGVLNPRRLWALVVLVMGVSGVGHIALRALGPRMGLAVAGFVGGFVSSAATVSAMGGRTRRQPGMVRSAVAGAVLSSVATLLLMVLILLAASPPLARAMAVPLAFASLTAVAYALIFAVRAVRDAADAHSAPGRAFSLQAAFLFALTVSAISLVAAAAQQRLGAAGVLLTAAIAGLADSQTAAIPVAALVAAGKLDSAAAVLPVLAAITANALTKAVIAVTAGSRRFSLEVLPGLLLVVLAAWLGFWLF
jgi:uncharacterized membrane protein (DUF4010 family)